VATYLDYLDYFKEGDWIVVDAGWDTDLDEGDVWIEPEDVVHWVVSYAKRYWADLREETTGEEHTFELWIIRVEAMTDREAGEYDTGYYYVAILIDDDIVYDDLFEDMGAADEFAVLREDLSHLIDIIDPQCSKLPWHKRFSLRKALWG